MGGACWSGATKKLHRILTMGSCLRRNDGGKRDGEVVKKVLDVRVEKKALGGGGVAAAHIGPKQVVSCVQSDKLKA